MVDKCGTMYLGAKKAILFVQFMFDGIWKQDISYTAFDKKRKRDRPV